MKKKKNEINIRSSAAEYLTYVASIGNQEDSIEMRYEDENIWLTQKMMAILYGVDVRTINDHIKKVFADSELEESATIRNFRIVQTEGTREVQRNTKHYNLQMIIAVGFKVNNERAVQFICGYMLYQGSYEVPQTPDSLYTNLIMLAQILSTAAVGIHLLVGKYVGLDQKTWGYHNSPKLLATSVVFIVAMGLWTNYFNELADLPNNMQEAFEMIMRNPLGIISVVIMAPIVEELLFRGAIQGHLLRKWKHPAGAIVLSSLIFGVVHGNWVQAPFAFVTGLALGWMYYRTGSLLPGILMHFVNNSAAVASFLLADDPNATMVSTYGQTGAALMAAAGMVLTIICVLFIQKKLVPQPAVWHQSAQAETIEIENNTLSSQTHSHNENI